ncbi:MAG: TIR domain-containing protein, partial [Rhodothermales bacterium]|nr:TIR domain-containing protein [Rhodothermales bacterium]
MEKPTVFISYSHRDEDWKDRLRPHLAALELLDELVVWDDRKIDGGERWYPEIQAAMERASVAVCLISAHYLASPFCVKDEVPFLLQRGDLLFLPVLVKPCLWAKYHWLSATQMLPRDGQTVAVDFEGKEDVVFTEVAARISTYLDEHALAPLTTPSWPPLPADAVDTARLPETGSALFGRLDELQMLDASWQDKETRLVSLVAHGGVGKSTLVNKWLALMAEDHYRGARRVFGWTFHSQGTGERVTSADYFIREALAFFGDPAPDDGSPWQKGERLARLVGEQRALLVLDGLEPLQSGQPFDRGQIKDPALRTLLRRLARSSQGLCLISTRVPVTDLAGRAAFREVDLERISPEAGRA